MKVCIVYTYVRTYVCICRGLLCHTYVRMYVRTYVCAYMHCTVVMCFKESFACIRICMLNSGHSEEIPVSQLMLYSF